MSKKRNYLFSERDRGTNHTHFLEVKEELIIFASIYSIILSIFFGILGFPQILKSKGDISLNNLWDGIFLLFGMENGHLLIIFCEQVFWSLLLITPIMLFWYLFNRIISELKYYSIYPRMESSVPKYLSPILMPLVLWVISMVISFILCFVTGAYRSVVFAIIMHFIPLIVIPYSIFRFITIADTVKGD